MIHNRLAVPGVASATRADTAATAPVPTVKYVIVPMTTAIPIYFVTWPVVDDQNGTGYRVSKRISLFKG